jgi:hypothetical protein
MRLPSQVIFKLSHLENEPMFIWNISVAAIMDLGFHTHAVSLDSKYVGLVSNYDSTSAQLNITGRE